MFNLSGDKVLAIAENGIELKTDQVCGLVSSFQYETTIRRLVFSLCTNTTGSLGGYVAMVESGMLVPVMLDSGMDREILSGLIDTYEPHYFWCSQKNADKISRNTQPVVAFEDYVLLKDVDRCEQAITLHPELALLLTTSGSTGSPKLVRLTYRNLESNAISIAKYLNITQTERPITSLPMHYSYGLSVINSHLIQGATLLLTDRSIMEKQFWDIFREQGATSLSGVPYTYQMLKRLRIERMDLPSLRTLTQAGGKLSVDLVSEFVHWAQDTGRKFFVMYGQTEATARMSYLPWEDAQEKSASIGIAIPGGKFSIIDPQEKEITQSESPGELLYQGPNVSMGYAECAADLALGDQNAGVLHTGDVAQKDKDGFYYIVGRLKRFVKVFGNRVNLDHIEQLAKNIWVDCACTGVDDRLTVYITDSTLTNQMRDYLATKTGLHPSAIDVRGVQEIPKNSSGKTQYSLLK